MRRSKIQGGYQAPEGGEKTTTPTTGTGVTNPQRSIEICEASDVTTELVKLRIGVARIAQILDLSGVHGNKVTPYQELFQRASTIDRGWNTLCGEIADVVAKVI